MAIEIRPTLLFELTWPDDLALVKEYQFHPFRNWRFDYAYLPGKVAVEIEGGIWKEGRHTRPSGFIKDCEKYNAATALGWRVFRLPPDLITTEHLQPIIRICRETIHSQS